MNQDGDGAGVDKLLAIIIYYLELATTPPRLPRSPRHLVCTRMSHVKQCAGRIALYTHILRLGQADQRTQRSRPSDLGLVLLVGCQVSDTTDGVTLHFNIGRHHLADQRGQPSESDDQDFVLS
jgi:hypothetical protein